MDQQKMGLKTVNKQVRIKLKTNFSSREEYGMVYQVLQLRILTKIKNKNI